MAGFYKNAFAKEEEIEWSSSAYKNQNFRFINWEGILLVDLLPVIQRDYKLDTYSLKNVCSTFFKNNTKDPVTHKDIFEAFNTRDSALLTTVGKYCVQDSALCIDLMNHLHTWVHLCEMARCCNVPIFTIFTQGQQVRLYSQIYKYCVNNNTVVTTNGYSVNTNERYRGALVHEPNPGFYKNVCPLDFASLYPSIIKHMRTEYFTGNGVTDRKSRTKWEQEGKMDARERAGRMAKKILSAPEVSYLPEEVDRAIRLKYKEIVTV